MKITLDNKRTSIDFVELVEGEAFIYRDVYGNETIYIYAVDDDLHSDVVLLQVTSNGLITRSVPKELVLDWQVQPLEITGISFAPSTCHKNW
jgi:hypothetical protein